MIEDIPSLPPHEDPPNVIYPSREWHTKTYPMWLSHDFRIKSKWKPWQRLLPRETEPMSVTVDESGAQFSIGPIHRTNTAAPMCIDMHKRSRSSSQWHRASSPPYATTKFLLLWFVALDCDIICASENFPSSHFHDWPDITHQAGMTQLEAVWLEAWVSCLGKKRCLRVV